MRSTGGITALVHTKNEEARIAFALRSLRPWVDEMLVVDMCSSDRTVEIAESLGASVVQTPDVGYVEPARADAVRSVATRWVALLDADEVVSKPLADAFLQTAYADDADVVFSSHLNYFMGRPLLTTDWGYRVDRHLRFFKPDMLLFSSAIHSQPVVVASARVKQLPADPALAVHHFLYTDFSHFMQKMDRYTDYEASLLLDEPDGLSARRALLAGGREFLRRYGRNRGFTEDYRAFSASALMITYRLLAWAKAKQLRDVGDRQAVVDAYSAIAEQLLLEHEGTRL